VLSAVRDADDRAFDVNVLADACGDFDAQIHELMIDRILPAQARILTTAGFCET
jgi:nicotinamidase-related amidase